MPVLILATASFLSFFFIVALLCIANTLESRTLRGKRSPPQGTLALLSIAEAFDPIYSVLWEAPIAALELIDMQKLLVAFRKFMTAAVFCAGFSFWRRLS